MTDLDSGSSVSPNYRPVAWSSRAAISGRTRFIISPPDDDVTSSRGRFKTSLVADFRKHKEKWIRETRHLSSPVDLYMHPSYVRIIALGPDVLALILADLKAEKNDWFYALQYIAGENPVTPSMAGDFRKMREAWLRWGEARGYS